MAFNRDVQSLETLMYRYFAKNVKSMESITEATIDRAHRILSPDTHASQRVKATMTRHLVDSGRFGDDPYPPNYFHPSFQSIEILGAKISRPFVTKLASICATELRQVNFSGCFRLDDKAVEILCRSCPNLQRLNVENCRKLSDRTLETLVVQSPQLEHLDVGGNFNMTSTGLVHVLSTHPNARAFESLGLSGHHLTLEIMTLMSSDTFSNLKHFRMGYVQTMTDATLQAFISARCSTLEELELHWHEQLTDTSLQFIARHCSNLSSLNLCGVKTITNDAIVQFIQQQMDTNVTTSSTPDMAEDVMSVDNEKNENVIFGAPLRSPEEEPPSKKFKTIHLKYTNIVKETARYLRESYPELNVII